MSKTRFKNVKDGLVENKESHHQLRGKDLQHYQNQMKQMFGDTTVPAVRYKGDVIPRRVLSDFSMLTN